MQDDPLNSLSISSSPSLDPSPHKDFNFSKSFESSISSISDSALQQTPSQKEDPAPSKKKKRNKEDLNKTPIPIFSCIYCSNESIAFDHLSRTIISDKYLIAGSSFDVAFITDILERKKDKKNQVLMMTFDMIDKNTEYLKEVYDSQKIEDFFIKMKNKVTIDNIDVMINQKNKYKTQNTSSSISLNINSDVTNNNKSNNANNIALKQLNSIGLDSIVENIDNSEDEDDQDDFFNFLKFDLRRKINRNDIEWDTKPFSIWDPSFSDDSTSEVNEIFIEDKSNVVPSTANNNKKSVMSLSSFSSSIVDANNNIVGECSGVSCPKPKVYISAYSRAKSKGKNNTSNSKTMMKSTQCESKVSNNNSSSFNLNSVLSFSSSYHNELHYKKIDVSRNSIIKDKGRISFNKKAKDILDLINSNDDIERGCKTKRRMKSIVSYEYSNRSSRNGNKMYGDNFLKRMSYLIKK